VLDLLFTLATWHGYAKLRIHTETTLTFFDNITAVLGRMLRHFVRVTCQNFDTQELPREEAARGQRKAARAAKKGVDKGKEKAGVDKEKEKAVNPQRRKVLNLLTYKVHALGDYVKAIWRFGTTDNYSTQVVSTNIFLGLDVLDILIQGELEHRRVKRFYARTNKFQFTAQIAKHQQRERILRKIRHRVQQANATQAKPAVVAFEESEPLPQTPPSVHHHMSESTRHWENITAWLATNRADPALKVS
jgi:hypothetical protein